MQTKRNNHLNQCPICLTLLNSKGDCVNDKCEPINCFQCPHMKRDDRPFVDRRFYCGLKPEEKKRVTTIYDCTCVPNECPKWRGEK